MRDSHHELRNEDLGARLRAARELAGTDQRDLAQAAGISRRDLQAAERGAKRLSDDALRALAHALGVDPDVLIGVGFDGELKRAAVDGHATATTVPNPTTTNRSTGATESHEAARPAETTIPEHTEAEHSVAEHTATEHTAPEHTAAASDPPGRERRKDFATRNRIEGTWREVRAEMGDALTSCARLISAGSGDDVRRLIERLEHDLAEVKSRTTFQSKLGQHERALERARGQKDARTSADSVASGPS